MSARPNQQQATPRGAKAAATHARLLDAARDAFSELGYPNTRVADVVARAGTSHGTFYTNFDVKKDVLFALTEASAKELYGTAIAAPDEPLGDALELIRFRTRSFFDAYGSQWRFVLAWMQAGSLHPDVDDLRRQIQDSIADALAVTLAADQQRGAIPAGVDVRLAATALTQTVEATAHRRLANGQALDDEVSEQISQLFWAALYASPEHARSFAVGDPSRPTTKGSPHASLNGLGGVCRLPAATGCRSRAAA
jgi:AcrR family transcriptional regulator